jgi:hypothetical protein
MSLELYVFVSALPERARWQAAVDEVSVDLKLDPELDLRTDSGFSPCTIGGRASGFEIYVEDASEIAKVSPSLASVAGGRPSVICFRWGGDFAECACVMGASLALVRAFGATAYYPADDAVCDEAALEGDLRQCLAEM